MSPIKRSLFVVAATLLLSPASVFAESSRKAKLDNLVVMGDSLAAGFQNFSLYRQAQTAGFAALIAEQANTDLTLPLISYPGIPPLLKQSGGTIVREAGIGFRMNIFQQPTNIAVPGFTLGEMISRPYPGQPFQNPIDMLALNVLSLPGLRPGCGPRWTKGGFVISQLDCAVALRPDYVLLTAGANDALVALTFGAPPTPAAVFQAQYRQLMRTLKTTGATVVVANIPDVTSIPFLIPLNVYVAVCGHVPVGAVEGDYVVPNIVDPNSQNLNVCTNYAVRPKALIQAAQAAVGQFNQIIAAEAATTRAVVVDFYSLFNSLANGIKVRGVLLTPAPNGGLFSLDGIHPTNTGYGILANEFITTMNEKLRLKIPTVSLEKIAKDDPLFPRK